MTYLGRGETMVERKKVIKNLISKLMIMKEKKDILGF